MGVIGGHSDDSTVPDDGGLLGEVGLEELYSRVVILSNDEILEHNIAHLFSQDSVLKVLIDCEVVVFRLNGGVVQPWVVGVAVISYWLARVGSGLQLEQPQPESSI